MNDALGLSIGTTNLVAVRNGNPPVTRRAVLTLFPHRRPEIGVHAENPDLTEPGTVMSGFVERVGDPDALMCTDGSAHDPALLLVEALDTMAYTAGAATASADIAIAVPAHWRPESLQALRDALRTHADFVRSGVAPRLVSDAVAALAAVNSRANLPARGVVGLLDFGGGGTTIMLADTASGFQPINEPLRYPEFSGVQIDDAVLAHVLDDLGYAGEVDPAATAAVGPFVQLREECRQAKERLSTQTETELIADLPGHRFSVRLTRAEFENLIADPLNGVIGVFDDMLVRHTVGSTDLAAVAMVGGGASIPLIAQRLTSHMRVPVVTMAQPAQSMALGAALFASGQTDTDVEPPTAMAAMAGADATTGIVGLSIDGALGDDGDSSTLHELAWSQVDDDTGDEPMVYTGEPYQTGAVAPPVRYGPAAEPPAERPRGQSRMAQLTVGLSALVAMIAIGGVAYTLTSTGHEAPRAPTVTTAVPPPAPSSQPPSPSPTPLPPPSVAPTTSAAAPPPPPPPATTTYRPPATTTTTVRPTTATTTPTTTTTTTTMTTPPTTTMTIPATTATTPMTTEYLTIPFVPMPIPVQVPQNGVGPNQP